MKSSRFKAQKKGGLKSFEMPKTIRAVERQKKLKG